MFSKKDKIKSLNDKLLEKAAGGNKDAESAVEEREGSEKGLIGAAAAANPPSPSVPIPKPSDVIAVDKGLKKEEPKKNAFGKLISRFKS